MEKKKKTWTEPKLTVLVRGKPEEGILSSCKVEGGVYGFGSTQNRCFKYDPCQDVCDAISQS